ncbi:MAG: DJ-1/PfpI family protein [Algoriphagus sp.]|nr:DJ-1/PfpI family protein [Algoriphagus sp.]
MKQLGILLFDDVEVLDFAGPFEVFSVANQLSDYRLLEVHTFAQNKLPVRTRNGLQVLPDHSIASINSLDYLVLPGGDGTKKIIQNSPYIEQIKQQVLGSEWTMSVCSGSRILGKAGFLEYKPYCTHHLVYAYIQEMVPSALAQPNLRYVQSDERIWTAAGISAGIDLSLHLVELTFGKELALATANYMEYTPYSNPHAR